MIRARLAAGVLRSAPVAQTWAGPGVEQPCDACNSTIGNDDTEFEIVFNDGRTQRLHLGCHLVWEQERHSASAA